MAEQSRRLADSSRHAQPKLSKRRHKQQEALVEGLQRIEADRQNALSRLCMTHGERNVARTSSRMSMENLFDSWTKREPGKEMCEYDEHMSGHDEAVRKLIAMALAIHAAKVEGPRTDRVLMELSCCTGTVIKNIVQVLREIDPEAAAHLKIIANDLSTHAQEEARQKLKQMGVEPTFTNHDIRFSLPDGLVDLIVLSQTLHLITDPHALLREQRGVEEANDENHRGIKTETIRLAFSRLKNHGLFFLFDEWPAKLTRRRAGGPELDPDIQMQFDATFRPVGTKSDFRDRIMANVPGARFVAEFRIRIDRDHSMNLFVYEKDPVKLKKTRNRTPYPSTREEARNSSTSLEVCNRARANALERLMEKFGRMDRVFIEQYLPVNGEVALWETIRPVEAAERVFDTRKDSAETLNGSKYDKIIIANLHDISQERREFLVQAAVDALNPGGCIIFTGEWPAPRRSKNPLEKRQMRNGLIEKHQSRLIFEAALREPIDRMYDEYGSAHYLWAYRKKKDITSTS